jgi:hypothetical protein
MQSERIGTQVCAKSITAGNRAGGSRAAAPRGWAAVEAALGATAP